MKEIISPGLSVTLMVVVGSVVVGSVVVGSVVVVVAGVVVGLTVVVGSTKTNEQIIIINIKKIIWKCYFP